MPAIHIICHREEGRLKNLVRSEIEKGIYTSGCWALHDKDDPAALVGGWLFFIHKRTRRLKLEELFDLIVSANERIQPKKTVSRLHLR